MRANIITRVLVVRLGALGDVISSFYIAPQLPDQYELHYLIDKPSLSFAELFIKNINFLSRDNKIALLFQLIKLRIIGKKYHKIIVLHPSLVLVIFFKILYPFAAVYGFTYKKNYYDSFEYWNDHINSVENFYNLVKKALPNINRTPVSSLFQSSILFKYKKKALSSKIPRIVASVGVGNNYARGHNKAWPLENWKELVFLFNGHFEFVGTGKENFNFIEELRLLFPSKVLNMVDKLEPLELAQDIKDATVYIGNDSGLLHLASFLGTTSLGLYGPTSYQQCGPGFHNTGLLINKNNFYINASSNCRSCYIPSQGMKSKMYTCSNNICMQSIDVNTVVVKLSNIISNLND
jgi:heptosyltransferase-2